MSINLRMRDVEKLAYPYNIGRVLDYRALNHGYMNYTYAVTTDVGRYILRIGKKTKEKKDILFEIKLVNSLHDLPVPNYIADKNGMYINTFNGHYYTFYQYLKGNMPPQITPALRRQLATFLARFHVQTREYNTAQDRFSWYTFSDARAEEFAQLIIQKLPTYTQDVHYLKRKLLSNRLPETLPQGPIHCDIRRYNVLCAGDRLTGVVDFDNCQIGPYILDLAIAINWVCTNKKGLDYRKVHAFVKEYEKIRKLQAIEKKYLFQAIIYAYISHEFVDYYVFAKGIIDEDYFQFGREVFLSAVKKLDRNTFYWRVESPVAVVCNLV